MTECDQLRAENDRLREANLRLKSHLIIGTDYLKAPCDVYEVIKREDLTNLRKALQNLIAKVEGGFMLNGTTMRAAVEEAKAILK